MTFLVKKLLPLLNYRWKRTISPHAKLYKIRSVRSYKYFMTEIEALYCITIHLDSVCQCRRKEDASSCGGSNCPCFGSKIKCKPACKCRNSCRNSSVFFSDKPCSCGQADRNNPHCLPPEPKSQKRGCPCRKQEKPCTSKCRCCNCANGKEETRLQKERSSRDDASPYKRKRTSEYCKDIGDELKHGRWNELESITLIAIFKMARRMQISEDDLEDEVADMFNTFVEFNNTLEVPLGIRKKSLNQIRFKLIHLSK